MTDLYATAILRDHPIGYWRLNERLRSDPVVDESGNGHHGTIAGQPILTEPSAIQGIADNSITFVPDSYIEIPHSPAFSIQSSGQGLTVEVWMRPDTLMFQGEEGKNYIHWLGKGQRARGPKEEEKMEWGFRFYSKSDLKRPNRISAYAWNPQGGLGAGDYCSGDLVKEGVWLHLVACFEPYACSCVNKSGVQLFVNGEHVQGPPSSGTLYFNEGYWSVLPRCRTAPLRIGTRSATANSFLAGGIDEVAIYPCVLTPEKIKRHYDLGMGR